MVSVSRGYCLNSMRVLPSSMPEALASMKDWVSSIRRRSQNMVSANSAPTTKGTRQPHAFIASGLTERCTTISTASAVNCPPIRVT